VTRLAGKRILVVEDNFLIAAMVGNMLASVSATVVGPARTVEEGIALARVELLDGAVLDVDLSGESSDLISAELQRRRIPFILATGYAAGRLREKIDAPVISKPFTEVSLLQTLARAIDSGSSEKARQR
jgi:CheY-like chemotaxis protein